MLFSLAPALNVYHSSGGGSNFVYLNTKKTFQELPIGIGFGGDVGNFRLWIDGEFASGTVKRIDTTYRKGPLLDTYDYEIAEMVVWGAGGEDAEEAQRQNRAQEAKQVEGRRKVNKKLAAGEWREGPDKWIMDMMGKTGASDGYENDHKMEEPKGPQKIITENF